MNIKTITIAGEAYPVKLGNKAIVSILELEEKERLQDVIDILGNPKAAHIHKIVHALIVNGIKVAESEQKPPKLEAIAHALDCDFMLWTKVQTAALAEFIEAAKDAPETTEEEEPQGN